MAPALYPTAEAAIAGPADGVKAVAMTLANQPEPAMALRASLTCTCPSGPLMTPAPTVLARVPRLPAVGGTLMESEPPVTVTVALVASAAEAGAAVPRIVSAVAAVMASGRSLRIVGPS
jgi:hypothetical protein